jgi:hypothetical protein
MTINSKKLKLKFVFRPPTRAEYEHVLTQLFKRGYVFDPNSRCTDVTEVWSRWRHLETDYPFLALYEGTNVLDSYAALDKSYHRFITHVPTVETIAPFTI